MVWASISEDLAAMPASLHDTIAAAIRSVLSDTGRSAHEISPSSLLGSDLGLDSLDFAQTIVMLERTLGVDPFRAAPASSGQPRLRTFADLCQVYESLPSAIPPVSSPHALPCDHP